MDQIRIVIADDHPMVRDALRAWIEQEPDLMVLGEAATCLETMRICEFERPDVLLQDLQMPDGNGLEVIRRLKASVPTLRILAVSGLDKNYAQVALEAGADGFLTKEERRGVILEAIRWAATKTTGTWISPLTLQAATLREIQVQKHHLTSAEHEVLKLLKWSNTQIASHLYISEGTVKNHVSAIYSKLGLKTRQEAIQWAERNGFFLTECDTSPKRS